MTLKFKTTQVDWSEIGRRQEAIRAAIKAAMKETAANAVQEGRQDIAGAGRFGSMWQKGLRYKIEDDPAVNPEAIIFHSIGRAGVFEYGATIAGKPLLWIPTTPGAPRAGRSGKKLVSATVRGQPMLFDAADRDPHRKPLYIGVPSVRIPKKW